MTVTPFTHDPTHKTVWDVRTNGNVFPGLTVWDVHKNGNVFLGWTVCDIHTNGNVFLGFTVWDVYTNGNNWVSMPRPIAHKLILPQPVSQEGLSPTVSWSCWKDPPYRPHSLGDGSKCRRGKGLKPVCLGPTCTNVVQKNLQKVSWHLDFIW